jgi:hypothetical protein
MINVQNLWVKSHIPALVIGLEKVQNNKRIRIGGSVSPSTIGPPGETLDKHTPFGCKLSSEEQSKFASLLHHADLVINTNEHLIEQHPRRVAIRVAEMCVRLGLTPEASYKAIEGSLFHDCGKLHVRCQDWLKVFRGKPLSRKKHLESEQVLYFRGLHTSMGPSMLEYANLVHIRSQKSELDEVCLHHNDPFKDIRGPMKLIIGVIQPADYFDARTSGEGDHTHCLLTSEMALTVMDELCEREELHLPSYHALRLTLGLSQG